jgi:hypothetical protein
MHRAPAALAVFAFGVLAGGPARAGEAPNSITQKWTPWAEFGGFYGTDNSSFGEAIVFAPLMQGSRDLLFFEGRGKVFEEEARGQLRARLPANDRVGL